jgi:hypothetical protein
MRDKIYIYVIAAIFLLLLAWSPAAFVLEKIGLVEIEDLANYKDPERVYFFNSAERRVRFAAYGAVPDEHKYYGGNIPFTARLYMNTLNGIEQGKAQIDTVYTNYLPFYARLLRFMNLTDTNIQDEFVYMLWNWENRRTEASAAQAAQPTLTDNGNTDLSDGDGAPQPVTEPAPPPLSFISSKIADAGMFRVYRVRSTDNSIGFLDISMAMPHRTAAAHMLDEQAHVNRIAAANKNVNFFVYIATRMQDMAYYNDIVSGEPSTYDIFSDFINGLSDDVAGVSWFDIDTLDKRLERVFKTDHHWNALGTYQAYTEIIAMMQEVIPEMSDPLPLKGLIEFPNVQFRGSGAARTNTPSYYDAFAVLDIDLPRQHPTERVRSRLDEYLQGRWDIDRLSRNDYTAHYENFYDTPQIITYPDNNTGRNLLILGDSYVYWVSWLIGANFDRTFVHYTLWQNDLDYNRFIRENNITDVLLLQYSARTLSKATSATRYLEQIITR